MIHLKYLTYLLRHKWFVLIAGLKIKAPLWQLLVHDLSKFLPSEWKPYAQYFYWTQEQKDIETTAAFCKYGICEGAPWGHFVSDRFSVAWNYHQKRNKHHWQYWLLKNDDGETFPVGMPTDYIYEMVADWSGAGRALNGEWEVKSWYLKNYHKILIQWEDRNLVNHLIGVKECEIPAKYNL